jgi:hypothetical protein
MVEPRAILSILVALGWNPWFTCRPFVPWPVILRTKISVQIERHSVNVQHIINFERKDVTTPLPYTLSEYGWMPQQSASTKPLDIAPYQRASNRKLADELHGIAFRYTVQLNARTLHQSFSVSSWPSFINFTSTSFFLVTISPPLPVVAPPPSFWRQSLELAFLAWTETSSLAMRATQPPSVGRNNFTFYDFTCTDHKYSDKR